MMSEDQGNNEEDDDWDLGGWRENFPKNTNVTP